MFGIDELLGWCKQRRENLLTQLEVLESRRTGNRASKAALRDIERLRVAIDDLDGLLAIHGH